MLVPLATHLHSVSFHYEGALRTLEGIREGARPSGLGVLHTGGRGRLEGPPPPLGWLSSPSLRAPRPSPTPHKALGAASLPLLAPLEARPPTEELSCPPGASWGAGLAEPRLTCHPQALLRSGDKQPHTLAPHRQLAFLPALQAGRATPLLVRAPGPHSFLGRLLPTAGLL